MHAKRSIIGALITLAVGILSVVAIAAPEGAEERLGAGDHVYRWVPGWGRLPDGSMLGNTHGCIVVDGQERVLVNTDTERAVVGFTTAGDHLFDWGADLAGGLHGMALVQRGDDEHLLLAHTTRHEVLETTLDGDVVWRLGFPAESGLYDDAKQFRPTAVAEAPDGRLFVADGYGRSYVHRYDAERNYLGSFGGKGRMLGQLRTPHGLHIDLRTGTPRLLVCDRENNRLHYFDLDGNPLGVVQGMLRRPCNVAAHGGHLAVADLAGRVTILDENDELVTHLGDNPDPKLRARNKIDHGHWHDGEFLSPHGIAFDRDGNLYVMDWNFRGRVSKLERVREDPEEPEAARAPGAGAVGPERLPFQPMDVFELELAADPQISPDGAWVAYVRNSMDVQTDRQVGRIWLRSVEGDYHRPLLAEPLPGEGSPRWSPDGTRIALVAQVDGKTQLHVSWLDTRQTYPLTSLEHAPSAPVWSPDGRRLAFSARVPVASTPFAKLPSPPKGASWAKPPVVIDRMRYRQDGAGLVEQTTRQLFVVSADGGTARQVTRGDADYGNPSWTADGQALLFSANLDPDRDYQLRESEVHRVELSSGRVTTLTRRRGPDHSPVASPDGQHIAYLGHDDDGTSYQTSALHVMGADGSASRVLTAELDRQVSDPRWSSDGQHLFFRTTDRGVGKVCRVSLEGEVETLVDDLGGLALGRPYASGAYSVGGDGTIAYTRSRWDRPADLAVRRPDAEPRALTSLNEDVLAHRDLGRLEHHTFSSGEFEIDAWVLFPPEFDPTERHPLVLEIHGGPHAAYGPHFAAELLLYAAAGHVVLFTNPRGSSSYGKAFGAAIHHRYPGEDYDDLMATVDGVLERGYVDPDRLFVTGGSGGGVLTAWIVGKTDRFAAAVVAKPVINWTSFVLTADHAYYFQNAWFPKAPWEDPLGYHERSPLSLVGNITTPTMVLVGENDLRTPVSESEQLYQALKALRVDTLLVKVPGASHGIARRPSNLIAKATYILEWFRRHEPEEGH